MAGNHDSGLCITTRFTTATSSAAKWVPGYLRLSRNLFQSPRSRYGTRRRCCFNAGPPSATLAQHWNSIATSFSVQPVNTLYTGPMLYPGRNQRVFHDILEGNNTLYVNSRKTGQTAENTHIKYCRSGNFRKVLIFANLARRTNSCDFF